MIVDCVARVRDGANGSAFQIPSAQSENVAASCQTRVMPARLCLHRHRVAVMFGAPGRITYSTVW